jgi:hypothetical protein
MKFLIQSLVLACPCLAFYPYKISSTDQPTSASTTYERRSIDDSNIRFPLRQIRRSNTFSISKAIPPSQASSAGIDQYGADISYMVEVQFGPGKKTLYLLLDTAAVNTWVMGSSCTTDACTNHNTYGPSDSPSLQVKNKKRAHS